MSQSVRRTVDASPVEPRIGTAGWGIPRDDDAAFPRGGSRLERYAARLRCVEINSSFYRSHRRSTYERWAHSVPDAFRFSVKMPKEITHVGRLADCDDAIERFLGEIGGLGVKLGVLLVQLPASFGFDASRAGAFFEVLKKRSGAALACEPRHASWFGSDADALLQRWFVARVAADPAVVAAAVEPGGWDGLVYLRLHGSPQTYVSTYDDARLDEIAARLRGASVPAWCIFDNTKFGAATRNALAVDAAIRMPR